MNLESQGFPSSETETSPVVCPSTNRAAFLRAKEQIAIRFPCLYSRILVKCLRLYLNESKQVWNRLPEAVRLLMPGRAYGQHLQGLVRRLAQRQQYFATFFLRNRAELELMRRLANQKAQHSPLDISVLACSKGAEVYSILWTIRSARPDLRINMHAIDISQEILDFAEQGTYSLTSVDVFKQMDQEVVTEKGDVAWNTCRDQLTSIFERMSNEELDAMFDIEGDRAKIKAYLKEGITWIRGDASDPEIVTSLGPQDMVVANRFLCHMAPDPAQKCLRNIARLVNPGGYLFVSGVDLDVRTKVARELGWKPVMELMKGVHEGDASLRRGWPLEYWGLEPFCEKRHDWMIRYAAVFQIGQATSFD